MKYLKKDTNKGFTLLELLVVVAVIGLLSSIVFSSLSSARAKGRDARRISDIKQLQTALEFYYDKNGVYPILNWTSSYQSTWTTSLGVALQEFLPTMVVDPINESGQATSGYKSYSYYGTGYYPVGGRTGQWYMLVFNLENKNTTLDSINGSKACNGAFFNYGGTTDGYIITVGGNCTY